MSKPRAETRLQQPIAVFLLRVQAYPAWHCLALIAWPLHSDVWLVHITPYRQCGMKAGIVRSDAQKNELRGILMVLQGYESPVGTRSRFGDPRVTDEFSESQKQRPVFSIARICKTQNSTVTTFNAEVSQDPGAQGQKHVHGVDAWVGRQMSAFL